MFWFSWHITTLFLSQQSYSIALPGLKRNADKDLAPGNRGLFYGAIPSMAWKTLEARATKPARTADNLAKAQSD